MDDVSIMPISQFRPRGGGPSPKFNEYHVWKALQFLEPSRPIGRKNLSEKLKIGEGSTRTVLSILSNQGLIVIRKSGIILSPAGVQKKNEFNISPIQINEKLPIEGKCVVGAIIPKSIQEPLSGMKLRNLVLDQGQIDALVFSLRNGTVTNLDTLVSVDTPLQSTLFNLFHPIEGDLIIIGSQDNYDATEMAVITAIIHVTGGAEPSPTGAFTQDSINNNELVALAFMIHDLVGGLPTCAKPRNGLGVRIENGKVIDGAYTGAVMEEVLETGTTIRRIATVGPYKGIRVIVSPLEFNNRIVASIGVVDVRRMAGINNPIRLVDDDDY